jgi:hypothetical protein
MWLVNQVRSRAKGKQVMPEGPQGVKALGHRTYVGGLWEEIGKLQFDFLVSQGLLPHHYLLDIACGSLRAGVHFIPYLERGHYLGLEKEQDLVSAGIERELGPSLLSEKAPCFVISSSFEFQKFGLEPDYALAQSLFTHLTASHISDCFAKLRKVIAQNGVFYATFNETASEMVNPERSHDHDVFWYTQEQMLAFGAANGWRGEYVGDWHHPRNQKMMRYRAL